MTKRVFTKERRVFEINWAAIAGCRTVDDLKKYFKDHHDGQMVNWVSEHPLTSLEMIQEVIKA